MPRQHSPLDSRRLASICRALSIFSILWLAGTTAAQTASFTYIDQKGPYRNWKPAGLTVVTKPKLGSMFEFKMRGNPFWPHSPAYRLAIGLSNPNVSVPALGGYLYSSGEIVRLAPLIFHSGPATIHYPVPNSVRWLGVRFYLQVMVVPYCSYGNCPSQPRLSRGVAGVFGR